MPEAVRSETKGVVKKPSCVSRSLRAYRRSVSLSPPVPRLSPRHTPLLTVTGVSRVNDGTEGGEGTETPRDRREHGERRTADHGRSLLIRRTLTSLIHSSLWSLGSSFFLSSFPS